MADIYSSSRYRNQKVDYIQTASNGPIKPIVFYEFDDTTNFSYRVHVYKQGEKLDQLSYLYYGRPDMWWVITEYNPTIRDFFNIPPGTLLRVPNV